MLKLALRKVQSAKHPTRKRGYHMELQMRNERRTAPAKASPTTSGLRSVQCPRNEQLLISTFNSLALPNHKNDKEHGQSLFKPNPCLRIICCMLMSQPLCLHFPGQKQTSCLSLHGQSARNSSECWRFLANSYANSIGCPAID